MKQSFDSTDLSIGYVLRFLKFIKPYWFQEVILFILIIFDNVASLASPYALKLIIDDVFPSRDYSFLLQILSILAIVYILRSFANFGKDYLYIRISNNVVLAIRKYCFEKIIQMPMREFERKDKGQLVDRINNDVNEIREGLTGSIVIGISDILQLAAIIAALCWMNLNLFLISVCLYPLIFYSISRFSPKIKEHVKLVREKEGSMLSLIVERFDLVKAIKLNSSYDHEVGRFVSHNEDLNQSRISNEIYSSANRNIIILMLSISPVITLAWGGSQVLSGIMTLGSLVAFVQYLNRLYSPARDVFRLYDDILRTAVSIKRIMEILSLDSESERKAGICLIPKSNITMKDVSLILGNSKILDGLNISFEVGGKYALVGPSGAGKSTIFNLLNLLYTDYTGQIMVDGIEIKKLNIEQWRHYIYLITQESLLFDDTVLANLLYGTNSKDRDYYEELIEKTEINQIVAEFHKDMEQNIGVRGQKLSGGQRQKIDIARAIIKKPEVLLLDESTSAIDSIQEERILDYLLHQFRYKTIILISHRWSSVKKMSDIVYLDNGKILEQLDISQVTKGQSYCYELFRSQIENDKSAEFINK